MIVSDYVEELEAEEVGLDIVRPKMDKFIADDIVGYFKKQKGFEDVPDFMIRDVYKTYYNPQEEIRYECNEMMYWWHEMLQNANNYLLKTVTTNKPGYSFIATKHIIDLLRVQIEENEDFKNMLDNMQGDNDQDGEGQPQPGDGNGGGGNQPNMDQINQNIQNGMDKAVKKASDEIQKKEDAQEAMGGGDIAGKTPSDIELLEDRMEMIRDVVLSKGEVGRLIKHSIKGFKKGFGTRTIITEETMLEADVVDDLIDQHYLFHEALAMDVNVRDHQSQMVAFDLYIDISGSMSSQMSIYGKNVSRINMAIALAARMNAMGCLGELYKFNGAIYPMKDVDDIWKLRVDGGTNIELCMQQIKKLGRPSVILTDGDDGFQTYTENAFIMTIAPNVGRGYFSQPACERMIKNKKYIQYDGRKLVTPKLSK